MYIYNIYIYNIYIYIAGTKSGVATKYNFLYIHYICKSRCVIIFIHPKPPPQTSPLTAITGSAIKVALWTGRKASPAQVAVSDNHHQCAV